MADRPDNEPAANGGTDVEQAAGSASPRRESSRSLAGRHRVTAAVILLLGVGLLWWTQRIPLARWNAARVMAKTARTLEGFEGDTWSVAFSPDGQWLSAPSGTRIQLRDTRTGQESLVLEGHTDQVLRLAFSPDGRTLASASLDKTVRLWDTGSGRELLMLSGHTDGVVSVAFSPDGRQVASASRDKTARLWDVRTGQETRTLTGHAGYVVDVSYSPDGRYLAAAASFRPFNTGSGTIMLDEPGEITLWDVTTGEKLHALTGHSSAIIDVAFSPDGKSLASASRDKTARLWDTASGRELKTLAGHTDWVVSVAFSPDGQRLATAGAENNGTVRIWNPHTGQETLLLRADRTGALCVTFSPDNRWLVTGGYSSVTLWDLSPLDDLP